MSTRLSTQTAKIDDFFLVAELFAYCNAQIKSKVSFPRNINQDRDTVTAETKRGSWRREPDTFFGVTIGAGDKLFTFPRFRESQWKSIRTSNGIERLHEEFKRRIKTQTVLPSAETAAMLFWALLASGQITMTAPVAKTINTLLGAPRPCGRISENVGQGIPKSLFR